MAELVRAKIGVLITFRIRQESNPPLPSCVNVDPTPACDRVKAREFLYIKRFDTFKNGLNKKPRV